MRKIVLVFLTVVWAAMPLAASAQGPMGMYYDDMMGRGMMMGRGGGCAMAGALGALDLSADQETKINKIFEELRREHWPLMGKILDERSKLHDLYSEDTLDAKKIAAVSDTISGIHKQMLMTKIEAINKVRTLLTKEQLAQLKKQGGWGMMGCGMGGGMMGGMGWRGCGTMGGMGRGGGSMMRHMMMDN